MKALRILRTVVVHSASKLTKNNLNPPATICRLYASQPEQDGFATTTSSASEDDESTSDSIFDSSQYTLLNNKASDLVAETARCPTWDDKYRAKANRAIFGEQTDPRILERKEEKRRRAAALAKALLQAGLERPDQEEEEQILVEEEDQKSLSVGIIGAPNAGKSALTNYMVRSSLLSFYI